MWWITPNLLDMLLKDFYFGLGFDFSFMLLPFRLGFECANFKVSGLREQILKLLLLKLTIDLRYFISLPYTIWIHLCGLSATKAWSLLKTSVLKMNNGPIVVHLTVKLDNSLFLVILSFRFLQEWVKRNWSTSCRGLEALVRQPQRSNLTVAEQPLTTMMTFEKAEENKNQTKLKIPIFEPTITAEIFSR